MKAKIYYDDEKELMRAVQGASLIYDVWDFKVNSLRLIEKTLESEKEIALFDKIKEKFLESIENYNLNELTS